MIQKIQKQRACARHLAIKGYIYLMCAIFFSFKLVTQQNDATAHPAKILYRNQHCIRNPFNPKHFFNIHKELQKFSRFICYHYLPLT